MKIKQIGIVVKKISSDAMFGELVYAGINPVKTDDDSIRIKEVIYRKPFKVRFVNGESLVVTESTVDFYYSKEICKCLQEIGYSNVTLIFNEKRYKDF